MIIQVFNIEWDIISEEAELLKLPSEVNLEIPDKTWDIVSLDPDDCIADELSDFYGYCLLGFDYECE